MYGSVYLWCFLLVGIPFGIVIPKELTVKNPGSGLPIKFGIENFGFPMTALINGVSWLVLKILGVDIEKIWIM